MHAQLIDYTPNSRWLPTFVGADGNVRGGIAISQVATAALERWLRMLEAVHGLRRVAGGPLLAGNPTGNLRDVSQSIVPLLLSHANRFVLHS